MSRTFRTFRTDIKVRRSPPGLKPSGRTSDWCGVVKLAIVAAVMTTSIIATGSAEAAVLVGSSLGTLLRR